MYLNRSIIFITVFFLITGCSNDSSDDFIEQNPVGEDITYTNDVKEIIDLNCIKCHAEIPINGAPMPLTTYQNVKDAILSRNLINRISRENGQAGLMPNGGPRMLQTKIDIIIQWELGGFKP